MLLVSVSLSEASLELPPVQQVLKLFLELQLVASKNHDLFTGVPPPFPASSLGTQRGTQQGGMLGVSEGTREFLTLLAVSGIMPRSLRGARAPFKRRTPPEAAGEPETHECLHQASRVIPPHWGLLSVFPAVVRLFLRDLCRVLPGSKGSSGVSREARELPLERSGVRTLCPRRWCFRVPSRCTQH